MSDVTVVTASTPMRTRLLGEAIMSVRAQRLLPSEHLISVDLHQRGGWWTKNSLIRRVSTEWVQLLDDDDLLHPHHLERLMAEASPDVDIIYSYADGANYTGWYNKPFDPESLLKDNNVSHNALVRKSVFNKVGMFKQVFGYDWLFWVEAYRAGAKFKCVPEVTWTYRIDDGWTHESHNREGYEEVKRIING